MVLHCLRSGQGCPSPKQSGGWPRAHPASDLLASRSLGPAGPSPAANSFRGFPSRSSPAGRGGRFVRFSWHLPPDLRHRDAPCRLPVNPSVPPDTSSVPPMTFCVSPEKLSVSPMTFSQAPKASRRRSDTSSRCPMTSRPVPDKSRWLPNASPPHRRLLGRHPRLPAPPLSTESRHAHSLPRPWPPRLLRLLLAE